MTSELRHAVERPASPAERSRRPQVPTWLIALGLVALHLAVAFQVRPNPRWNDAIFVLNDARDYPDVPLDQHALRIGNLLPARLFLDIFGYGQVAYYAWGFLCGIFLVVATFALGTTLFGRWTGAAAAVLIIFHPVLVLTDIRFGIERMVSWHLLPDVPSAAFFTAGLALLIAGSKRRTDGVVTAAPWWFLGAGLCLGWAYLVRELTVFLFPVVLGVLVAWRLPIRRWLQVAAPMAACLVLEVVLAKFVYGDWLARLHVGEEHVGVPPAGFSRLDAILRFPRTVEAYPQTVVVFTTLALTVLGALLTRRREYVLPLGWFLSLWLPLTLVSGLLDPGQIRMNASLIRYWVPILPALCIGAAGAVHALLVAVHRRAPNTVRRPVTALSALGVAAALAVASVPLFDEIADNPGDAKWNSLRAWMQRHDRTVATVITDDRDALTLGIYRYRPLGGELAWHARIEPVPHAQRSAPPAPADPGTVLVWTPELARRPPEADLGWRLVFKRPELRIYVPSAAGA